MDLPPPRALEKDEWPLLLELLRVVHERSTPDSYPDEYPLMLQPEQASNLFVIRAPDGPILSHVGTFQRILRLGPLRLPVALVGSVATHPQARGQGLAARTLAAAHTALRDAGILMTFLWSEDRNLYRAAGYHPVGRSLLFRVEAGTPLEPDPALHFRPARPEDLPAISVLLETRPGALERTAGEHARLAGLPGVEAFVAERGERVVAVLYVGKGSDLRHIGHDWAGEAGDVMRLVVWTRTQRAGRLGLLTPDYPNPMAALALRARWPSTELPVAQACVLLPEQMLELLEPHLSEPQRKMLWEPRSAGTETDVPLEQRLFGPMPAVPGPLMPSFFVWGLDSM